MSLFGGSGFGQPQQSSGLFGGQQPASSGTGLGFGINQPANNTQSSGFGGLGAKPASSGFGQPAAQTGGSSFGQANKPAATPSPFGTNTANKPPSTGLFGNSTPNTANTGGSFGNTNTNTTTNSGGLFGNNSGTQSGGLFGNNNNNNNSTQNGGLFGNNNTTNTSTAGSSGLFGNAPKPAGGLFGNSQPATNTGGGLFGNANSAPKTGGSFSSTNSGAAPSFGAQNSSQNTNSSQNGNASQHANLPPQQSSVASLDQASYTLQGVAPAQKLYTSSSVPAKKRSAPESDVFSYESRPAAARNRAVSTRTGHHSARSSQSKPGTPENPSTGPHLSAAGKHVSAPSTASKNEPRKWINSYENFIRERPTTSIIGKKAQIKPMRSLTDGDRSSAASTSPVATAPPTAIEDIPRLSTGYDDSSTADKPDAMTDAMTDATADADVSSFHRQANNMTLVQVNPQAIEEGYYIYPRLEQLASMSKPDLASVRNLVIGRKGFGKIEYSQPVDSSRLHNLGDILGKLVVFEAGIVCVYPEEGRKAPRGHESNMPATISIENAWPKDSATHAPITNMEDKRIIKHIARSRKICAERGSEYVTFTNGIWVFRVPHFSTWGSPVDEMVIDNDEDFVDTDEERPEPAEPAVIVDSVVPHIASSPILGALDELADDGAHRQSVESSEYVEKPNSWLEQLDHASKTVLLANAQSLEAASRSTDQSNSGSILVPAAQRADNADSASSSNSSSRGSSVSQNTDDARTLDIQQAAESLAPLRRLIKKEARPTNDSPSLHCAASFSTLASVHPSKTRSWRSSSLLYEKSGAGEAKDGSSAWFDEQVKSANINFHNNALDGIWQSSLKHDISGAFHQASSHNNPHLALLISSSASQETRAVARENATQQSADWKNTGFTSSIPVPIRRMWELVAGKLPGGSVLTWEQWLGVHSWYLDTSSSQAAVQSSPSSSSSTKNEFLGFLQYYAGVRQLRTALGESDLVSAFSCLQASYECSPHAVKADMKGYDNICSKLARASQDERKYVDAAFVALHINDSKTALQTVRKILIDMPSSVSSPSEFGILDPSIHEARALQVAKLGEYKSQCEHLVHAGLYDDAHKVLIAEVGPEAVLTDKTQDISGLLNTSAEHKSSISKWELGGGVYLTYANVLQDGPDNYSIMSSCNACRYIDTPTLESREAISRIAEWVAATPYAQRHISADMISGMKFAPSQTRIECMQQSAYLLF